MADRLRSILEAVWGDRSSVSDVLRGRRAIGVDVSDGVSTTVETIAWPDGTFTLRRIDQAEATMREAMIAVQDGYLDDRQTHRQTDEEE